MRSTYTAFAADNFRIHYKIATEANEEVWMKKKWQVKKWILSSGKSNVI